MWLSARPFAVIERHVRTILEKKVKQSTKLTMLCIQTNDVKRIVLVFHVNDIISRTKPLLLKNGRHAFKYLHMGHLHIYSITSDIEKLKEDYIDIRVIRHTIQHHHRINAAKEIVERMVWKRKVQVYYYTVLVGRQLKRLVTSIQSSGSLWVH
jgi:hypothetical protein